MKKNYLISTVFICITFCLLIACNTKKAAILQPEQNLSIITGLPEKIEFILEDGETFSQNVIEIYGYSISHVKELPALPELSRNSDNRKPIKMSKDSIEVYTPIIPGNYYSIIISSGPNYLCTLYDNQGYPIHPMRNFQLMTPNGRMMESYICKIINRKDISTEGVIIGSEDFMYLQKTKLCYLCYIEVDKKDKIVSSGIVTFPAFGAIGNVIQKKADPKAEKIYVKVVYKGMFGVSVKPCDENLNFLSL